MINVGRWVLRTALGATTKLKKGGDLLTLQKMAPPRGVEPLFPG